MARAAVVAAVVVVVASARQAIRRARVNNDCAPISYSRPRRPRRAEQRRQCRLHTRPRSCACSLSRVVVSQRVTRPRERDPDVVVCCHKLVLSLLPPVHAQLCACVPARRKKRLRMPKRWWLSTSDRRPGEREQKKKRSRFILKKRRKPTEK